MKKIENYPQTNLIAPRYQGKQIGILVKDGREARIAMAYLATLLGKSVPEFIWEDVTGGYPVVCYNAGNSVTCYANKDLVEVCLPFDRMDEYSAPPVVKIKLNEEYEADIHPDIVKVGCQNIPFEKIKEVYEAMLEMR
jgi:hypothetical protein